MNSACSSASGVVEHLRPMYELGCGIFAVRMHPENLALVAPHDILFRGIGADLEYVEVQILHFDPRCCRLLAAKVPIEIHGAPCGLGFVWPMFALALRLV